MSGLFPHAYRNVLKGSSGYGYTGLFSLKVSHVAANLRSLKESVIKGQNYTMSPGPYLSEHVVISGNRLGSLLTIFRI